MSGCVRDVRKRVVKRLKRKPQKHYVDIDTRAYPDGAVRGQLHKVTGRRPARRRARNVSPGWIEGRLISALQHYARKRLAIVTAISTTATVTTIAKR